MSPPDPDLVLAGLSPANCAIAELKALIGAPVTKGVFVEIVRAVAPCRPMVGLGPRPR